MGHSHISMELTMWHVFVRENNSSLFDITCGIHALHIRRVATVVGLGMLVPFVDKTNPERTKQKGPFVLEFLCDETIVVYGTTRLVLRCNSGCSRSTSSVGRTNHVLVPVS